MLKDVSTLSPKNAHAEINLSLASLGRKTFRITHNQIVLPSERNAAVVHLASDLTQVLVGTFRSSTAVDCTSYLKSISKS